MSPFNNEFVRLEDETSDNSADSDYYEEYTEEDENSEEYYSHDDYTAEDSHAEEDVDHPPAAGAPRCKLPSQHGITQLPPPRGGPWPHHGPSQPAQSPGD